MSIDFNEYLVYDESSPSFLRWKVDRFCGRKHSVKTVSKGDIAGTKQKAGYWRVWINNKSYLAHRIVYYLFNREFVVEDSSIFIDHEDRDKTNSRIGNLRVASRELNMRNKLMSKRNSSGITGVRYIPYGGSSRTVAYWHAQCWNKGKREHKYFSVAIHGYEEAFRLACEYRTKMIAQLNINGAGYTERHGT